MASAAPPSEYFNGINFNLSFYTAGDSSVSLNYVNSNFLRCTGYAYSRSISTTFNGILYCLNGIDTTNINASGTVTANLFSGSGASLTNTTTTTTDLINMNYNSTNGLRYQQSYVAANDIKYNVIQKHNNVDINALTYYRGNVGIGITTPADTDKLSVSGNAKITGTATINTNLVVGGSASIVGTSQFTGNVGIGTSPTTNLHVYNATNAQLSLHTTSLGTAALEFKRAGDIDITPDYRIINDTDSILKLQCSNNLVNYSDSLAQFLWVSTTGSTGYFKFFKNTEFATPVSITGTTNTLGIGITADTTYKINIQGSLPRIRLLDPTVNGGGVLMFREVDDLNGMDVAYVSPDKKLYFSSCNASSTPVVRMAIDRTNGNVGIGTTSTTTYKLNVNGSIYAASLITANAGITTNSISSLGTTGPMYIDPNFTTNNYVQMYDDVRVQGVFSVSGAATIGGNVNVGSLNNIGIGDFWRKSTMVLYLYRTSTVGGSWSQFLINANLLLSEYGRPAVQWRWVMGISTGEAGRGLSWGFFTVIYDQNTNGFNMTRIVGSTDIDITQNWDGSGWNRCVITIYNANPPNYINVNIY